MTINDTVRKSMEIISELIKGKNIDEYENTNLLKNYELNSEVNYMVDELLEFFSCSVYQGENRGLFISPSIDNQYFGFSNAKLRKELVVDTNPQLYMCYFIMSTIITLYFKDDSGLTIKDYITTIDVVEEVSKRINALKEGLDTNAFSKELLENEEGCLKLIDVWEKEFTDTLNLSKDIVKNTSGKSKIAVTNRVLGFMESQGLIRYEEHFNAYYREERFKTIISQAYKESRYTSFVSSLYTEEERANILNGGEDTTGL